MANEDPGNGEIAEKLQRMLETSAEHQQAAIDSLTKFDRIGVAEADLACIAHRKQRAIDELNSSPNKATDTVLRIIHDLCMEEDDRSAVNHLECATESCWGTEDWFLKELKSGKVW